MPNRLHFILRKQHGYALMAALVMVVVMGLGVGIAASSWRTKVRRSHEQELLWRGDQYRKAIASYYRMVHGGARGSYPRNLESLKNDPRVLHRLRHIRRLYKDPLTGEDFILIKDGSGGIIGVRSESNSEPFKKDGFSYDNARLTNCKRYSEWEFIFRPTGEDQGS